MNPYCLMCDVLLSAGILCPDCFRKLQEQREKRRGVNTSEYVVSKNGFTSSPCSAYEKIPLSATTALANRMEYGVKRKGAGAWNALTPKEIDKEFVLNRLGHGIKHCQEAVARLVGSMGPLPQEEVDAGGDAGAIMFAGALLAEYLEQQKSQTK